MDDFEAAQAELLSGLEGEDFLDVGLNPAPADPAPPAVQAPEPQPLQPPPNPLAHALDPPSHHLSSPPSLPAQHSLQPSPQQFHSPQPQHSPQGQPLQGPGQLLSPQARQPPPSHHFHPSPQPLPPQHQLQGHPGQALPRPHPGQAPQHPAQQVQAQGHPPAVYQQSPVPLSHQPRPQPVYPQQQPQHQQQPAPQHVAYYEYYGKHGMVGSSGGMAYASSSGASSGAGGAGPSEAPRLSHLSPSSQPAAGPRAVSARPVYVLQQPPPGTVGQPTRYRILHQLPSGQLVQAPYPGQQLVYRYASAPPPRHVYPVATPKALPTPSAAAPQGPSGQVLSVSSALPQAFPTAQGAKPMIQIVRGAQVRPMVGGQAGLAQEPLPPASVTAPLAHFVQREAPVVVEDVKRKSVSKGAEASSEAAKARLLSPRGWDKLNEWLKASEKKKDSDCLLRLLHDCLQLPVTLALLKRNDTPKLIKRLSLKFPNTEVRNLSADIVSLWKDVVAREGAEEKSAEASTVAASGESAWGLEVSEDEEPSPPPQPAKAMKEVSLFEKVLASTPHTDVPKRPKLRKATARTKESRFRSTGLEEGGADEPVAKQRRKEAAVPPAMPALGRALPKGLSIPKLKTLPPKPQPDAQPKAEPKAEAKAEGTSGPAYLPQTTSGLPSPPLATGAGALSPTDKSPKTRVPAKPAKVMESSLFMDALGPAAAKPKPKVVRRKKKPSPEAEEANGEKKPEVTSPLGGMLEGASTAGNPLFQEDKGRAGPLRGGRSGSGSEVRRGSEGPADAFAVRQTKIRWADSDPARDLVEVRYFQMDESERTLVTSWTGQEGAKGMATLEAKREKEALMRARKNRGHNDEEDAQPRWGLVPIRGLPPCAIEGGPGSLSTEKAVEEERQSKVLALLPHLSALEPCAAEPDSANRFAQTDAPPPKDIPLEDTSAADEPMAEAESAGGAGGSALPAELTNLLSGLKNTGLLATPAGASAPQGPGPQPVPPPQPSGGLLPVPTLAQQPAQVSQTFPAAALNQNFVPPPSLQNLSPADQQILLQQLQAKQQMQQQQMGQPQISQQMGPGPGMGQMGGGIQPTQQLGPAFIQGGGPGGGPAGPGGHNGPGGPFRGPPPFRGRGGFRGRFGPRDGPRGPPRLPRHLVPCREIVQKGECSFGDYCRFKHDLPGLPMAKAKERAAAQAPREGRDDFDYYRRGGRGGGWRPRGRSPPRDQRDQRDQHSGSRSPPDHGPRGHGSPPQHSSRAGGGSPNGAQRSPPRDRPEQTSPEDPAPSS